MTESSAGTALHFAQIGEDAPRQRQRSGNGRSGVVAGVVNVVRRWRGVGSQLGESRQQSVVGRIQGLDRLNLGFDDFLLVGHFAFLAVQFVFQWHQSRHHRLQLIVGQLLLLLLLLLFNFVHLQLHFVHFIISLVQLPSTTFHRVSCETFRHFQRVWFGHLFDNIEKNSSRSFDLLHHFSTNFEWKGATQQRNGR